MEHAAADPATETRVLLDKNSNGVPTLVPKPQLFSGGAADGSTHLVKVRRKKARDDSLVGAFCGWLEAHQIGLSVNLLILLALTHACFPRARPTTRKFFELSYYDAATGKYTHGWDDFPFVFFGIVVFTALRAATMDYVLKPLARLGGIQKKKATVRFAEQGWLLVYCSIFWTLGMYINYNSSYWLNLYEMWSNWPIRQISGLMKGYYLLQFAFWLQQILVINMEERRKDHWQMFTHHIITSVLVSMSYSYYHTRVGNVILCLMDVVDIFLASAKLLKYLGYQTACDIGFGIFIASWVIARHVLYIAVCWSIHVSLPIAAPYGCYNSVSGNRLPDSPTTPADGGDELMYEIWQPFRDPEGPVCFNARIRRAFLGLLGGLQVITLVWFWMIIKVAYRVVTGQGADDTRSDDEGDEDETVGDDENADRGKHGKPANGTAALSIDRKPLEEEVGVEGLHFGTPTRRRSERLYKRSSSRASGISISGTSDRKELLGRIGCEKPVKD
ncbi:nuclear protein localization protein 4 [Diplodia corticola]|uniref:Nuclear protein localization protein 4 n=1 Tax=Diplodia corticola TaxID=236234 RepID=A0A1J9R138_9PEZI|nr:nuclear protein localization protein 4 [Diplodia corticola]OJD35110.1 nuclear protein localization protein 4 [Diplodia corticola]